MLTSRIHSLTQRFAAFTLASSLGLGLSTVAASPVLYAGTGQEKVHSTEVLLMTKDGKSVLTVMPDYDGPLEDFALIMAVPKGTSKAGFQTIKRQYLNRVTQVSAPRFAEFWEMDPCDDAKLEQAWERDLTANSSSAFLGEVKTDPKARVAKEMLLDLTVKTKKGEYKVGYLGSAGGLKAWLGRKDYQLPSGGDAAIDAYSDKGYSFLALDVDADMLELIGGDRAQLSPFQVALPKAISSIPLRFGLPSAAPFQELNLYTMLPEQRMQVKNYDTLAAPTNLLVDFKVKERMGEYYAALHDLFLKKHPETFLLEYAFTTAGCTKPCVTEPLQPGEILTLGGAVFEKGVSGSEKNPAPPEMTEEEELKLEGQIQGKPARVQAKIKKDFQAARKELARRKALVARNEFVLTRLHYRYNSESLPNDIELGPGGPVIGGLALPLGPDGAADTAVKGGKMNAFQTRFNSLHENKKVVECDEPKPHRWGKPPRTYRGANKIWAADDLSRRNRSQIKPSEMTFTAVPDLKIEGKSFAKPVAAPAALAEEKKEESGCSYSGSRRGQPWWSLVALLGVAALVIRRRSA